VSSGFQKLSNPPSTGEAGAAQLDRFAVTKKVTHTFNKYLQKALDSGILVNVVKTPPPAGNFMAMPKSEGFLI
jgi:hypothetical protein